ncbi:MAG: YihY/virulence factor BrkB family protein, partial [Phycicoccus sp.]
MSTEAGTGAAARRAATAPHEDSGTKPASPTELRAPTWRFTLRSAVAEFQRDQCTDLAAALTYYAVLSLFPGLIALVSLLGVFGQGESTVEALLDIVRGLGQPDVAEQLAGPVRSMVGAQGAGLGLVAGLAGAVWTASGYVGAFGRAMNRVYQIDEGRPVWRLRPTQLLVTVGLVVAAALVLVGVVVSGDLARTVGDVIGVGEQAVTVWNLAKWPVILVVVVAMIAVLYYATPNVRQPRFRWVSVGALVAIVTWVLASLAFGFYVGSFASYNRTYGSLAGVVVFLLWLWITNLALLFGAEIDAELERGRELQAGVRAEYRVQLPPRDTRQSEKAEAKQRRRVREARRLRRGQQPPDVARGHRVELEPLPSEAARTRG